VNKKTSALKTALFFLLWLAIALACLETGLRLAARLLSKNSQTSPRTMKQAPNANRLVGGPDYMMIDPQNPSANWLLKPSFRVTMGEYRETTSYKTYLAELQKRRGIKDDELFFQINRFGFKGPEISRKKPAGVIRIMTLGDSCTFGEFDKLSYPRVLERKLRKKGLKVEVINAGVEGYSPQNLILRLPYYLSFEPDYMSVFIGWNALDESPRILFWENHSRIFKTLRKFYLKLKSRAISKTPCYRPDPSYRYRPEVVPQVEELLEIISESGVKPVLLTMPGLFGQLPPSPQALQLGAQETQGNAFYLAEQTRRYNQALFSLALGKRIQLVDLAGWSQKAFTPREAYFFDAVHFNDRASEKIGIYLAKVLEPELKNPAQATNKKSRELNPGTFRR